MDSDVVIRVEKLGKRYRIRHQQEERYSLLRDVLAEKLGVPFRAMKRFWSPGAVSNSASPRKRSSPINRQRLEIESSGAVEDFWALKDISFEIKRGEVVGIIGKNGAGKSTLLKILSRITEPTAGEIQIRGRVASLLEVGTGFHPELTGRENIFLNGAVLGMTKEEIRRKFDAIIAFAEIEKFLDTPVKRYSSGMYVRLAFAVAAHLEPEILIVDEVLAVGDSAFQKKCLGKMRELSTGAGRTVLFVSHNLQAVEALTSRGLLLKNGTTQFDGEIGECVRTYGEHHQNLEARTWVRNGIPLGALSFQRMNLELNGAQPNLHLTISSILKSVRSHKPAFVAFDIVDSVGTSIMQVLPRCDGFLTEAKRDHELLVEVALPPLIPGVYGVTAWVGSHNTETLDQVTECLWFSIENSPIKNRTFPHHSSHGYIIPNSRLTCLS